MAKSAKRNAALMGVFLIAAITILFVLVVCLAGGSFMSSKETFSVFFDKSVKGLSIGAPVMFRGVRVGSVKSIRVSMRNVSKEEVAQILQNDMTQDVWKSLPVQVIIELEKGLLVSQMDLESNTKIMDLARDAQEKITGNTKIQRWLRAMVVKRGLRLQLQSLSLLTGQLYVEMDFFENSPLTPEEAEALEGGILPSRLSAFEKLQQGIAATEMADKLKTIEMAFDVFKDFVTSGKAEATLNNVHQISENVKIVSLQTQELIKNANAVLVNAQSAVGTFDKKMQTFDVGRLNAVLEKSDAVMTDLKKTTGGLKDVLESTKDMAGSGASTMKEMEFVIKELEQTSQAVRALVEALRRNPESLLHGR